MPPEPEQHLHSSFRQILTPLQSILQPFSEAQVQRGKRSPHPHLPLPSKYSGKQRKKALKPFSRRCHGSHNPIWTDQKKAR